MKHVDEGVLIAYTDGQLSQAARADTAKHILACPVCRERLDELAVSGRLLHDALTATDRPAPVQNAYARFRDSTADERRDRGGKLFGRTFIRAAGLVLLVAAGASAAVPGSPVRNWIRDTVVSRKDPVSAAAQADRMSGVSILPVDGRVDIAISRVAAGTRLRVRAVDGPRATVTVPGAGTTPEFHTSPGRIDVVGATGEVLVDVPKAATDVHVAVNGKPYVVGGRGALEAVVTAETRNGDLMFTLR